MSAWTTQWPTEPGLYWMYSRRFAVDKKPTLIFVRVQPWGSSTPTYVAEGTFLYESETPEGALWQPIIAPELPI